MKCNIKVSSTDSGQIFGNIVYDSTNSADHAVLNLHDIKIDIMDYTPATATRRLSATCGRVWWENKVAVNTKITDIKQYLQHIIQITNTNCLTPVRWLKLDYVAANLYACSSFGEDALVNVSESGRRFLVAERRLCVSLGRFASAAKPEGLL